MREPSRESLTTVLLALGAPLDGPRTSERALEAALRRREADVWDRMIEPVLVAWEGETPALTLRLPADHLPGTARVTLTLEDGAGVQGDLALRDLADNSTPHHVDGRTYYALRLPARRLRRALGPGAQRLPWGRHRLRVQVGGDEGEAWMIAAPRRCWDGGYETAAAAAQRGAGGLRGAGASPARPGSTARAEQLRATISPALEALAGKPWGLFAPVYALRSRRDWGAGDLADLAELARWTEQAGGSFVATLPLLASSFDADADPSPYRPISRLFWNEFFLAPEDTVEWTRCERARTLATGTEARQRRESLRAADFVDYQAVMALKRPVLAELARCFFEDASDERREDFEAYLQTYPDALDFAVFRTGGPAAARGPGSTRAAAQRRSARVPEDRLSRPVPGGAFSAVEQYHLYCQWQMDRQLAGAAGRGPGLLFDLPLGVHPQGFDTRRWPELFAAGMSTGAPPDSFFAAGQDWTTPPLHPAAGREDGHGYFAACLGNLMRYASIVRIDHMMSFHRLFWIPEGSDPRDGAYVTYPAEELYAVLSLQSHRFQASVVGEDLGTVPPGVRMAMRRHGVARTTILLGALRPGARTLEPAIPDGAIVTLETHDMVPLAGFLHGDDIETRVETGQADRGALRREAAARRHLVARLARVSGVPGDDAGAAAPVILRECLRMLGRSAAKAVLVNLDDLLLERRPHNVPGTEADRPNWRRKMAARLEDLSR